MKTAVIYARYSSDSQTEQSIEGQLRVCNDYAKNNKIVILKTYIDRGLSGTNDNRPDFQRMLYDSKKKEWDYVLVYKFDRFSRNKYETAIHKKMLKDNGIKVISATEFVPETPEGIILESLLEGYAEYYSAELSQKVRRGNNESRHKGNLTGGKVPYGYKNVNKKAVIDDEEAEIVRHIFTQYAYGVRLKEIVEELNSKGLTHYGKPFLTDTISKMLSNERYIGIYRYQNEIFDNIFPPIIDKETFDRVQQKAKQNKLGKTSLTMCFLLKGKVYCGYCGRRIAGDNGTGCKGEHRYYYTCGGKKKRLNDCKKTSIRKEALEKIVLDYIHNTLGEEKIMNEIVSRLIEEQRNINKDTTLLKCYLKEQKHTETSINNILSIIEKGEASTSILNRLRSLEERQQQLEQQIAIENAKKSYELTELEIRNYYSKAIHLTDKMLIEYLIKKIILFDDKMQIIFNSPLKHESPDPNGTGFLIGNKKTKRHYIISYGYTKKPKKVNTDTELLIG